VIVSVRQRSSADSYDRWRLQNGYPSTGNNGNIASQTLTVLNGTPWTTVYQYDGANRLALANEEPVSEETPACADDEDTDHWCEGYGYDSRGNRAITGMGHLGLPIGLPTSFGTDNRIADEDFEYDNEVENGRGNLTSIPTDERYIYDGENRQVAYCGSTVSPSDCTNPAVSLGKTFYYYDGEGRRVGKVSSGVMEIFVYDARGRLAAEYGGTSEVTGTHYLTADHLGSTRVITDSSKAVIQCRDYLPFGGEL